MLLYDLTEFLKLSALLNYQLSAKQVVWDNVVSIILWKKKLPPKDREILCQAFEYLDQVYGQKRRRLGPLSVLHPLRATALLAHALDPPNLLDLLTELLHDKFEDIRPDDFAQSDWTKLDAHFYQFIRSIPEVDEWFLMERLQWLTKGPGETYNTYIGRFLRQSKDTPEVVRVKLADRLDNTMDMRIDLEDPFQGVDFFETLFQITFINSYQGYSPDVPHAPAEIINGAQRLYQLYKNVVLMSLVRIHQSARDDVTAREIFRCLALAGMKEAQRVALHIFGYHITDPRVQRDLIRDSREYVQQGGIDEITVPGRGHRLDGLFMARFDDPVRATRDRKLAEMYEDKALMVEAAVAFIVIFLSFLDNPDYYVIGVTDQGARPRERKL